jgi:hypothetical protein
MRSDISKIIVERPRIDHSNMTKYNRAKENKNYDSLLRNGDFYDIKLNETIKPKGKGVVRKELNEYLAPLRRFLFSRIGQLWDNIYSEIRKNINFNSAIQKHVVDHLIGYVALDTELLSTGEIIRYKYNGKNSQKFVINNLENGYSKWNFYVHPTTKILHQACNTYKKIKYNRIFTPTHDLYQLSETEQYRKLPSGWFYVKLKPFVLCKDIKCDVIFKDYDIKRNIWFFKNEYGNVKLRAIEKRQLSKKEIKQINKLIKNNPEKYYIKGNG